MRGIRFSLEALLGLVLLGVLLTNIFQQVRQSSLRLTANVAAPSTEAAAVKGLGADFQSRWFGSPALWQPPPIDNTDIRFFDVSGSTQLELVRSLNSADICKIYGPCLPDPANPNKSGIAWGLEGFDSTSYVCYSPRTTTLVFREHVLLPRWSPMPLGGVQVRLVERWNALQKVIYVHEAGHVTVDVQDLAALNEQAHRMASCDALINFWSSPHVFDNLNADQNAYHARLRADCRPEIGCWTAGWMGW